MSLIPHDLGRQGEDAATSWLLSKDYRIVRRNYRYRRSEIDIIAMDGPTLCFIEVKTRATLDKGHPLEAVTPQKQKEIIRTAAAFLSMEFREEADCRFDVIAIIAKGYENDRLKEYEIEHITDAFWAE